MINRNWCFRETSCLHHHLQSQRQTQQMLPKSWYLCTKIHGITPAKSDRHFTANDAAKNAGICLENNYNPRDFKWSWRWLGRILSRTLRCWGKHWRSWLKHCATSRKVAGSIPHDVIGIFHWHNPYDRTMALGCGFGGLGVSALASRTQVRGFKPSRSRRIFQGEKILSAPSRGREVKPWVPCRWFTACKRSLGVSWKSESRQN
jgi:hypothetical protein